MASEDLKQLNLIVKADVQGSAEAIKQSLEKLSNDEDKVKSMVQLHYAYPNMDIDKTEVNFDDDTVSIKLDEITRFDQKSYMDVTLQRFRIAKDLWDNMDVSKVQFVDTFEKKDTESNEDEESEE